MISSRSIKLIGEENYKKVTNAKVAIFGLGGVGGTCFEALVRSGVEHFYIQDFDTVSLSNLNRQTLFNLSDVEQKKCSFICTNLIKLLSRKNHLKLQR